MHDPEHALGQQLRDRPNANLRSTPSPMHRLIGDGGSPSGGCVGDGRQADRLRRDAFGQGTPEDDANPTIVTGSIPPNKSDLKISASIPRSARPSKFLDLFTGQNPPGHKRGLRAEPEVLRPCGDADELRRQRQRPHRRRRSARPATRHVRPLEGGTVPTISIDRTEAWGRRRTPAAAKRWLGTLGNTAADTAARPRPARPARRRSLRLSPGAPRTSARLLKSRSSDSFTAEIKDFIAPERVNITTAPLTTNARLGDTRQSDHDTAP